MRIKPNVTNIKATDQRIIFNRFKLFPGHDNTPVTKKTIRFSINGRYGFGRYFQGLKFLTQNLLHNRFVY